MNDQSKLFENLVRTYISNQVKNRAPTERELSDAAKMMQSIVRLSDDDMFAVIRKLQSALDISMDSGISLQRVYAPWLNNRKIDIDFYYWNRYVSYLEQDMHRTSSVIASIDEVSDKVIELAGDPTAPGDLHRRGLIIGDVQSGKTANYIAIMNKAADVGYKVMILLTGVVESLRRQTQERVDEGFIGRSSKEYLQANRQTKVKGVGKQDARRFATAFTTESNDFRVTTMQSINASLSNMSAEPIVFVMKKNARTLQNLIRWLEQYNADNSGKIRMPLLLIDDEADNASINTRAENDPPAINKLIRRLLALFSSSSYIGVTATPFANIFILPDKTDDMENDDLFPSDFIYSLSPPSNYIGSNEIFGDDADYASSLITIDDADEFFPYKHPREITISGLPNSLHDALRYFLLTNIVRDIRGDVTEHRSMLINVSRFVAVQKRLSELVSEWLFETRRDIENYCMIDEERACKNDTLAMLRDAWNNPAYPFFKGTSIPWIDVQKNFLHKSVLPIEVRTINEKSNTKLDYTLYNETGLRVIAVGGMSLSRGLTLEGLMISYFHRNSQMYDTLMQMGRWFGYRENYKDLFRIWMPDDAISWYAHITQASNELREEISRMNRLGATPMEFGLKVRAHPTCLIVTARNKMKHAELVERWITLDGCFFETPRLKSDINVIRANLTRANKFVQKLMLSLGSPEISGNQPLFWRDVPREFVTEFLRTYDNHPLNMEADGIVLETYINNNDVFKSWNVLIHSSSAETSFVIEGLPIKPTKRLMSKHSGILSVYGSKMRIGTAGLTKNGLDEKEIDKAENEYRELKRQDYVTRYKEKADDKLLNMSFPDRAYLIPGRKPILILHYLIPDTLHREYKPIGLEKEIFIGYGIGFPALAGSEARYIRYYINTPEQRQQQSDESEEDQLDAIIDET